MSRFASDLYPSAILVVFEGRDPDLHRLGKQARPYVDQRLARLDQDLGAAPYAVVFRTAAGRHRISEEHRLRARVLDLCPHAVLDLGGGGGEPGTRPAQFADRLRTQ